MASFIRNATVRRCEIHEHEAMNRRRIFCQSCSHPSDTIIVTLGVILFFLDREFVINVHHHHQHSSFSSLMGVVANIPPANPESSEYSEKGGGLSPPPPPPSPPAPSLAAPRESPHVGGEVEAQYSVPQFCNHPMFYYVPGSRFEITTTAIYGTWYGKPNSEQPRNALKS